MSRIAQLPAELDLDTNAQYVAGVESSVSRALLGIATLLLLLMLPAIRPLLRFLVSLGPESLNWVWAGYADPLNGPVIVLLAAPLIAWVWTTRRHGNACSACRGSAPAMLAAIVIGLAALCVVWIHPRAQWFFIETSKIRLAPTTFPRALMFWRGSDLKETWPRGNTVALLGSSQMNFAVDQDRLQTALPEKTVAKRALPGLGIMQYALLGDQLIERGASCAVCWISDFDAFREEAIPANRLRYFATLKNTRELAQVLGIAESWRNRGALADMFAAALCPLWRDRDVISRVAKDFWRPLGRMNAMDDPSTGSNPSGSHDKQGAHLERLIRRTRLLEANFRSFNRFADTLSNHGVALVVFEGHTNPEAMANVNPAFRSETRQRIHRMAGIAGFTYVDETDMPALTAADFQDAYHLNDEARKRFTLYLADFLKNAVP